MRKVIDYLNCHSIFFGVDIFKIDESDSEFDAQIDAQLEDPIRMRNNSFSAGSLQDAIVTAKTLLTRDDDYNYAMISLIELDEDGEYLDSRVIGDVWSTEIDDSEGPAGGTA